MTSINHLDVRPTLTCAFDPSADTTEAVKAVKLEWTKTTSTATCVANRVEIQKTGKLQQLALAGKLAVLALGYTAIHTLFHALTFFMTKNEQGFENKFTFGNSLHSARSNESLLAVLDTYCQEARKTTDLARLQQLQEKSKVLIAVQQLETRFPGIKTNRIPLDPRPDAQKKHPSLPEQLHSNTELNQYLHGAEYVVALHKLVQHTLQVVQITGTDRSATANTIRV